MPVVGRRHGIIRGIAGMIMIHGIGILGIGMIRSTIPHGMAGIIHSITQHGIRPAITATMGITVHGMVVVTSAAVQAATCRLTCVAISVAITTAMVRAATVQVHVRAMLV